jgi:hypothetical protein
MKVMKIHEGAVLGAAFGGRHDRREDRNEQRPGKTTSEVLPHFRRDL